MILTCLSHPESGRTTFEARTSRGDAHVFRNAVTIT